MTKTKVILTDANIVSFEAALAHEGYVRTVHGYGPSLTLFDVWTKTGAPEWHIDGTPTGYVASKVE